MTVKKVAKPEPLAIDDEFAKSLGLESLEAMRKMMRERIEAELARASREKVKRKLLDALAKRYSFEVPEAWSSRNSARSGRRSSASRRSSGRSFADENTTEEAARAEYRAIAERRVRLGLLLAEVGAKAEVKISDEEMTQALIERARAFPGQEQQVWDYYRNNTRALAELRAPIYEEKVVDHILGLAKIEDKKVSREELMKPDDDDEKPAAETRNAAPRPKLAMLRPAAETGDAAPTTAADDARPRRKVEGPLFDRRPAPMLWASGPRFCMSEISCATSSTIIITIWCRS